MDPGCSAKVYALRAEPADNVIESIVLELITMTPAQLIFGRGLSTNSHCFVFVELHRTYHNLIRFFF